MDGEYIFAERDGWSYRSYPLSHAVWALPDHGPFIELWNSRRWGAELPGWARFDFLDFKPWLGWIALYEIALEPHFDISCRLWGSKIAAFYDFELTGRAMTHLEEPFFWQEDFAFWQHLSERRRIGVAEGPMEWRQRRHRSYESITVPLAADGRNTDMLLTLVTPRTNRL